MENENNEDNMPVYETQNVPNQPIISTVDIETLPKDEKLKRRFRLTKKEAIAACLIVVAFVVGAGGMYALTGNKEDDALDNQSPSVQVNIKTTPTPTAEVKPVTEKVDWLPVPQESAALPIFEDLKQYYGSSYGPDTDINTYIDDKTKYYQVGAIQGTQDKLYVVKYLNYVADTKLLVRSTGTSFVIYKQHSLEAFNDSNDDGIEEYTGPSLKSTVKINEDYQISEIIAADTITYDNQSLTQTGYHFSTSQFITTAAPESNEYVTYIKLGDLANGVLYQAVIKDEPMFKAVYYGLLLKSHQLYTYSYTDKILLGGTPDITWTDGSKNATSYRSAVIGCGNYNSIGIAKNIAESDVEIVGKAGDDKPIYGFKNSDNQLLNKEYEEYKSYHSYEKDYVSIDEFIKKHALYLAKDSFGQYILLANTDFFPVGGCAKPVVYLYPTVPTFVNVSVAADVTLSDPQYPLGGWRSVLALPNGQLVYNKQGYESLFWEGYGNGEYPSIKSGKIIKRADAEKQIAADLYAQGLNAKETKDFVEFWSPKIPAMPYVRLTWLNTGQMENLAKLNVYPKPQTLIRVFLDMQGVEKPYDLPYQQLQSTTRSGFTVVEWGGLARDGSVPKLR